MITRILVGAPTTNGAEASVQAAAELATSYDAELIVLQVEPVVDARRVFDPDGVPEAPDHLLPLRQRYPGLRVHGHRARGNPLRSLCEVAARERSDLIVIPRGGPTSLLSRRASSALVQRAPCPVLLVAS